MATVYKNKDRWYITVHLNGERLTHSLKTKDKRVALRLKPQFESDLISELTRLKVRCENLTSPELSDRFIKHHTHWSESTYKLIKYILSCYIKDKPLPSNPISRPPPGNRDKNVNLLFLTSKFTRPKTKKTRMW